MPKRKSNQISKGEEEDAITGKSYVFKDGALTNNTSSNRSWREDLKKEACPICLEPLGNNLTMLPCTHAFHGVCLTNVLKNTDDNSDDDKIIHRTLVQCPCCRDYAGKVPQKVENIDKGSVYIGQVGKNGNRHGEGTYTFAGNVFDGEWKDGNRHGKGTYTWPSGSVYVGEWKDDKRHGKGTMTWAASGDVYDGEWKDGKQHGKGTYTYASGDVYDGDWKDDKRDGKGTYTWNSGSDKGDVYVGGFKNGKRHGKGKMSFVDGRVCVGEWDDDMFTNGMMDCKKRKDGSL